MENRAGGNVVKSKVIYGHGNRSLRATRFKIKKENGENHSPFFVGVL